MTFEETAKSTVRDAMDQSSETAQQARQAVKGVYKAVQQYADDELFSFDLGDFARREPWLAVAAAFAFGYVAAQLVRRVS